MSDKKRRDITLGEMQDECRKRNAFCGDTGVCPYRDFCHATVGDKDGWGDKGPRDWNLTDPPRFNEQQMALLNGLWEIGARKLTTYNVFDSAYYIIDKDDHSIGTILISIFGKAESPLDIAELLGKDGADEKA